MSPWRRGPGDEVWTYRYLRIGLVGAALGLVVGIAVQYLATVAIAHALTIDVHYQPSPLLLGYAAVALGLAMLGSIPPALRAGWLPIVEALTVE